MTPSVEEATQIIGFRALNRAFIGAWRKGWQAAETGAARHSPYADRRSGKYGNVITFSRGFQRFWFEGYDAALIWLDGLRDPALMPTPIAAPRAIPTANALQHAPAKPTP
jgi:hypothetical protein